MTPEAAVEAALSALLPDSDLESLKGGFWWGNVETILEAAAPHMLAGAWDDGHGTGRNDPYSLDPNPYRPTP